MDSMELRQLKYFKQIANTLNYSRAAEQLYISQPALTQQINALERELGVKLFFRTRQKVALTPEGKILLDCCEKMFALLDASIEEIRFMQDKANEKRSLTIGVDESASHLNKVGFFSIVNNFKSTHQGCELKLKYFSGDALFAALRLHEVDVGISIVMREELHTLPCMYQIYGRQRFVLCVPKAFAERHGANCLEEAIRQLDICIFTKDPRWEKNCDYVLQRMKLPCHPLHTDFYNALRTSVEAGTGAMIDVELCVDNDLLRIATPIEFPREKYEAYDVLLWNKEHVTPTLIEFLDSFDSIRVET